ncbi:MAG: sporulation integral membrane protein YlbJ [Lachnospiraceae bacterium]|nr:sporulation integral membrane protein YlbJ [Lachnospiraceae bacterium]
MNNPKKSKALLLIIPILIILFNILIILRPAEIIGAAKEGLLLWYTANVPSLLPFMITVNILMGLKAVEFFGVIFEPFMAPLFNVNGNGSFPFIAGMTSGYPMGAKVTSRLRQENLISKTEAQRLLAFSNNSGPLFILGAVGVGMFKNPSVGYFFMLIHYLGAILNGLIFKYYKKEKVKSVSRVKGTLFSDALEKMRIERIRDGRSFTMILSESLMDSMTAIVNIGGYIMLFFVVVKALEIVNIISIFESLLYPLIKILNISPEMFKGLFYGIFEITGGAGKLSALPLSRPVILLAGFILSFGGFSIHAQSSNFISKTDISMAIYILSKISHGLITALLGYILYPFFSFQTTAEVFGYYGLDPLRELIGSVIICIISLFAMFMTYFIIAAVSKFSEYRKKRNRLNGFPKYKKE